MLLPWMAILLNVVIIRLLLQALMWAACRGHIRVVHALLEGGADSRKQCSDGSRAIDLAAVNGQIQVMNLC